MPPVQREQLEVGDAGGELADVLADLVGEFARRAQHQRLQLHLRRIEPMQQAQAERRGLAAAGRRLRDQVAAFEQRRQALRLDRGHLHVAEGVETLEQRGIEWKVGEFAHAP